MNSDKKISKTGKFTRFGLIGAALGLYYGIFYTPGGEPDFGITVLLSFMAAVFTVIVRSWKKGFTFQKIIKDFLLMFGFYTIFLLSLALRTIAYQYFGKLGVIIETTAAGILLGLLMASQRFGVFGIKD